MKKLVLGLLSLLLIAPSVVKADEGMWLLPLIEKLNIKDMQKKGFKLSAKDLYNENGPSLMECVAIFGGGCTSEVISSEGLILTNHHCGYGSIQSHSSVEHDYLKDGFWAYQKSEELPTPGLKITFIRTIEEITDTILKDVTDSMSEDERSKAIDAAIKGIMDSYEAKNGMQVMVRSFYGGNQYYKFETQTYNDIRMVGAPPSSVGKFGGDTDNWMWPRHTGDFSLFRIYTDKDGNPAEYSADNVPYAPRKWFPISLDGVEKDDFAMVMGFPGSTQRYMTSYEIDETVEVNNPIRIKVRGIRQDVLMEAMKADQKTNIQYASKYSSSSNYWKNSIGMNRGLTRLKVKDSKKAIEDGFMAWVKADAAHTAKYGEALSLIEKGVAGRIPYSTVSQYIREALTTSAEIYRIAGMVERATAPKGAPGDRGPAAGGPRGGGDMSGMSPEKVKEMVTGFYDDYNADLDRKSAKATFKVFVEDIDPEFYPETIKAMVATGDLNGAIDELYETSIFSSEEKVLAFLENPSPEVLANDPAVKGGNEINKYSRDIASNLTQYNEMFYKGHRLFIAGLLEMNPEKAYSPDANFTLRMTYGNVLPYDPADAVTYDYVTTLDGVIEKEDPYNAYEFSVPEKLKELYQNKDYGRYGKDGELVVNFISNNDITGGNSGSPVINGKGELIGTAFDGNWEAMSGDIAFEPELQRTISVDIRYTLFIIDKLGGATNLIDEMTIVD